MRSPKRPYIEVLRSLVRESGGLQQIGGPMWAADVRLCREWAARRAFCAVGRFSLVFLAPPAITVSAIVQDVRLS